MNRRTLLQGALGASVGLAVGAHTSKLAHLPGLDSMAQHSSKLSYSGTSAVDASRLVHPTFGK